MAQVIKKRPELGSPDIKKSDMVYHSDKAKETVRGQFRNFETIGGNHKFMFCVDPDPQAEIVLYEMNDGEFYTIPLAVAQHLNRVHHVVDQRRIDPTTGLQSGIVKKQVRRFAFYYPDAIYAGMDNPNTIIEPDIVVQDMSARMMV